MYDIAVIGAGINGCSIAYEFLKEAKRVVVFDKEGIASGGSGAAGAFISPKFSKAGELKEIIEEAFIYSMEYYETNFYHFFTKAQLLHIAKDAAEEESLRVFKANTTLRLKEANEALVKNLTQKAKAKEHVSLDAGVVNAKGVCQKMAAGADFVTLEVKDIVYEDGYWLIEQQYAARELVLATGAYETILQEPYIGLRGVWGHRIDVQSSLQNPCSIHQFVSISPSSEGVMAIGATHNVHYHPQKSKEPYDLTQGRQELLQKARETVNLGEVEIVADYTGLRSGSHDYMPLLGQLVLANETLQCCEKKIRVKRPDYKEFLYYPNLYMINGSGGYGFVLAPYLAKMLKEHILSGKEISSRLSPARFFARWAKRS
ncbi:MAG: FAD-binding oxidoreductase [Epsilonproteobacteria bacterium]|nr:FAD-binding oxidoreductase [Campylobacterota bacterium]